MRVRVKNYQCKILFYSVQMFSESTQVFVMG